MKEEQTVKAWVEAADDVSVKKESSFPDGRSVMFEQRRANPRGYALLKRFEAVFADCSLSVLLDDILTSFPS